MRKMSVEDKNKDYKSIRKAIGKQSDLKSRAETCVCFANAQGGELIIGIEDKELAPPSSQKIKIEDVNEVIKKLRALTDGVGLINPEIITHENGGEFFVIRILPSTRTIATTTSGKVFIRISDNCFPVDSTELTNLAAEKTAFQWEIISAQKIQLSQVDQQNITNFVNDIRKSDKVSDFIKSKEDNEILDFYQLINSENTLFNDIL
jgi:ATP-dependent DNA helicase RecG